ncbi:MAG: type II toxin-antitoxin system ParD family antitoxin [Lyngbya sp. HA4199-MV5]|jgi:antitoxin ParD1/3/4|nr:type II toxin-antitoxin system ParD family antitoxin [Lyngbya sp. HA4199-MV5]
MTTLTVSLPEALTVYLQEQIASGHYSTVDDYIQALIQHDKERRTHLEPLLLEGLASGDPTPMTTTDWTTIRSNVQQNLTDRSE